MAFDGIVAKSCPRTSQRIIEREDRQDRTAGKADGFPHGSRHPPDKNGPSCLQAPPSHLYI